MSDVKPTLIVALPGAGARNTIIALYINKENAGRGTYSHLLIGEETHKTVDFDNLEKIIAAANQNCNPRIYGYQLATSIAADFLVDDKPVTIASILSREPAFYYLGGTILERTQLLEHCNHNLERLLKEFPPTSDYLLTIAGIMPFHKDRHHLLERRVKVPVS